MPSRKAALIAIKFAITLALIGYLIWRLDWSAIGQILLSLRVEPYLLAVLALGASYALTTFRWRCLLAGQGMAIPYGSALSIDLVATFLNSFLPGSTGGDAARVYYASALVPREVPRLVSSILLDRAIGLFVLLTFGYVAFLLRPAIVEHYVALRRILTVLPPVLACSAIAMVAVVFLPRRVLPDLVSGVLDRASAAPATRGILQFVRGLRRRPESLLLGLGATVVAQLTGFLAAFLSARALDLGIDYVEIALMLAIVQTAVSLPISIGGFGVRELVLIALFDAMGVAPGHPEVAVAFSVLLIVAQLSWSLVGGVWFLVRPRTPRPP